MAPHPCGAANLLPKFNNHLTQRIHRLKKICMQKEIGIEICRVCWEITEDVQSLMKIKHQSPQ
jgi:hypothetical protein